MAQSRTPNIFKVILSVDPQRLYYLVILSLDSRSSQTKDLIPAALRGQRTRGWRSA